MREGIGWGKGIGVKGCYVKLGVVVGGSNIDINRTGGHPGAYFLLQEKVILNITQTFCNRFLSKGTLGFKIN